MSFRTLAANLPLVHLSLTTVSVGVGIYGLPPPLYSKKSISTKESFDAKHYDLLTELVTQMYAGRGSHHPHCHFADTARFQDPAVILKSPKEIHEAFRILPKLQPKCLHPPICVDVEPKGSSFLVTYAVHQHYGALDIDLQSLVQVEVQLKQLSSSSNYVVPESDFLIVDMQELWNGNALLGSPLFWITRRINGILSWQVTSRFFE